MDFEIVINDELLNIDSEFTKSPADNKYGLGLINDFEEGTWRYTKFQNFIWDNIVQTALSNKERKSLAGKNHTMLVEAAKNLRLTDTMDDPSQGSELAEIALYGIMKNYYQALSVTPKIFYKQNVQDTAKGADSVHIVIESQNDFSLWIGEAKFYNGLTDDKLNAIVQSVKNALRTDKLKKENSIVTSLNEIDGLTGNEKLEKSIKDTLSPRESIDNIKPKLQIPIFILHECDVTQNSCEMSDEYKEQIKEKYKKIMSRYFKKQLRKLSSINKYNAIKFHLILFPVPNKSKIVDKFVENVKHYRGQ